MNTAISTNFLLWALLMFCCPDPGWTTQAEEMASLEVKMANIVDRMTRMEAEMVAEMEVRDQKIALLEAAMEKLQGSMQSRDTQMEEEMKSLTGRMNVTEETDVLLRGMVDQVRNPPYAFQCAWKNQWTADNRVITYDRLNFDEISGGGIYNVTGGLNINTGVFTVGQGYSGVWEISHTTRSTQYSGDYNNVWLYINGEQIEESSHVTGQSYIKSVKSLGSRSLYMRLESGDTISLRTGTVGYGLHDITLCFELAQFDYVPPM